MKIWIIEPRDPLIAGDGRPFGPNEGLRAKSLSFPFPSTVAGAVRTRAGLDGNGRFDKSCVSRVEQIRVRGPLLAEIEPDETIRWLAPAPRDALLFDNPDSIRRLVPLPSLPGVVSDLDDHGLSIVGMPHPDARKPSNKAPVFWYWDRFEEWLLNPRDDPFARADLGLDGPTADRRMHVAIDPATLTGLPGMLFMTSGLTFWQNDVHDETNLAGARRLGLGVEVAGTNGLIIRPGVGPLGGERRLMNWREGSQPFPSMPVKLKRAVAGVGNCVRVILLTPAHFTAGWKPDFLLQPRFGVEVELQAAAVGKPQTVSGWDLVARGPRPTRRLAPAGSVYFLKLSGSENDVGRWLDDIWFNCTSDAAGDRAAGFGLAAVGVGVAAPATISQKEETHAPETP